jgi:hypothetical protein
VPRATPEQSGEDLSETAWRTCRCLKTKPAIDGV